MFLYKWKTKLVWATTVWQITLTKVKGQSLVNFLNTRNYVKEKHLYSKTLSEKNIEIKVEDIIANDSSNYLMTESIMKLGKFYLST